MNLVSRLTWKLILTFTATLACAAAPNQLTEQETAAGWKLLFDGRTTNGWRSFKKQTFPAKGWGVEDDWLHCLGKGGGDIITDAEFDDFELQWEWKTGPSRQQRREVFRHRNPQRRARPRVSAHRRRAGNRTPSWLMASASPPPSTTCSSRRPKSQTKPPGEINQSRILVRATTWNTGSTGRKVLEYECGSEALKAAVAASKFKTTAGFGNKIKGHILLQDHHTEVWFRNLKIRELSGS